MCTTACGHAYFPLREEDRRGVTITSYMNRRKKSQIGSGVKEWE